MYEMYRWTEPGATATDAPASPADDELNAALQFALDRRDNGGDAAGRRQLGGRPSHPRKGLVDAFIA